MKLLRVDSSARGSSVTRGLTDLFVDSWKANYRQAVVVERDLHAMTLPFITDDWSGTFGDPSKLTEAQRRYLSTSDGLIEELKAADLIVIGAPMYNFMISWPLKAWIDQVVRLNKTVTYGEGGYRGLLEGKRAVVITSRGGSYSRDASTRDYDLQEAYLTRILGFIGLRDLTFIHAENQMRPSLAAACVAAAKQRITDFVSPRQAGDAA